MTANNAVYAMLNIETRTINLFAQTHKLTLQQACVHNFSHYAENNKIKLLMNCRNSSSWDVQYNQ